MSLQDTRGELDKVLGLFDLAGTVRDGLAASGVQSGEDMVQARRPKSTDNLLGLDMSGMPPSLMAAAEEKHGKAGLFFRNLLSKGGESILAPLLLPGVYGDEAKAEQKAKMALWSKGLETQISQQERDRLVGAQGEFHMAFTDGNFGNDQQAYMTAIAMGVDPEALEVAYGDDPMFERANAQQDTDIMRTTKAYVDSVNAKNKDKPGFKPMTFDEGYDVVKNYDAGRRGAQAGAVAGAKGSSESDFATFNTAKDDYISAFENANVLNSSLANVDRGIEMLANGEVDTGLFNGFIFNTFGLDIAEMGELNALSNNATIDKLMSFKGPTTDFEFSQSEAAAFADIMKGEDVNEGTMKTARSAIERAIKRNATLAESAYGTMTDMGKGLGKSGAVDIIGRNYKPWWQEEQPSSVGGDEATGNAEAMPEAEALELLRKNNTPENRAYFQEVYGKEATL